MTKPDVPPETPPGTVPCPRCGAPIPAVPGTTRCVACGAWLSVWRRTPSPGASA